MIRESKLMHLAWIPAWELVILKCPQESQRFCPSKLLLPLTTARKFREGTGTERDLPSASAAIPRVNFGVTVLPNTYYIIAKWEETNSIYKPLTYFQLKVMHVNS